MSIEKKAIDRAVLMLNIAAKHCEQFAGEEITHYDEADCDGGCIADDCREAATELEYQTTREREVVDQKELLDEADSLIRKAKDAARKLNTMYLRGEVSPRSELDCLIGAKEKLTAWLYKRRGLTYEPEEQGRRG